MNNTDDNKGFLKEKLGEYRVDPPESVWEHISARLGGGNRRTIILITLASAATIALAVTLGINYFGPDKSLERSISGLQPGIQEEQGLTEITPEQDLSPQGEAMESSEISSAKEQGGAGVEVPGERDKEESVEVAGEKEREEYRLPGDSRLKEKVLAVLESAQKDTVPPDPVKTAEAWNPPQDPAGQQLEQDHTPDRVADVEEVPLVEPLEWEEEKQTGQARWSLGAVLSPLYSFRDAEMDALEAGTDFESGMLSYAGGIQVSYRAAGRLAIESGLLFNKMGISIGAPGIMEFNSSLDYAMTEGAAERSNWVAVSNSVGNIVSKSGDIYVNNYKMNALVESGNFQDNLPVEATTAEEGIQQHLEYLELPVNLRYTLVDRTFELQLIGGLSTNFLVNNYVTMKTPDGKEEIGYLSNIRNVNYSGNAGLGMIYHIHSKFSLSLEPRFRYFLHSVNDETLPSTRPYSLGLYTGIRYTF
jgi:hypothetical protein